MGYRTIDHTGDLAVLVEEPRLEELYRTAAAALFELMVRADLSDGDPLEVAAEGADEADLLRAFLSDLLYNFSTQGTILRVDSVRVERGPRLVARGLARPFDRARDEFHAELKAVTYHQLDVHQDAQGWRARIVFDV